MNKINNRVRVLAFGLGLLIGGLPAYAATAGSYSGHQAIAGDFNGDGWTDLVLQPTAGNQGVAELIAYADGNFGSPTSTWKNKSGGTDWNADAHRLVVGDFNGDGRDDVLLQGAAGLPSQIAYSQPDGSVQKTDYVIPASLGGLDVSQANHHLVVGDFNGDGRDDILLQANTFVGTNAIALATPNGHFTSLAAKWQDGFKGLSWSLDHASIVAGDFSGDGRDELLLRSDSASGATKCCELMTLGADLKPDKMKQQWPANYLGVDWDPSTHLAIVGDFNGDGRDDVLLQPMAAGGELDVVLSNAAGHLAILSDKWNSERNGIDWSAQSYMLVPENAGPGKGSTLLMVPKQAGLPYRRAIFNSHGHLESVKTIKAPPGNIFSGASSDASGGGIQGTPGLHPMASTTTNTLSNANTVGAMNGQPSVNSGASGYSIKIAIPPGRAGMQPSLSLGYSSTGGDGHEGVGWSLGGMSSIYRCPATQATDHYTAGVTFSSNDRFCLDGQKLILTSGTYGGDGSIYHTEIDGFSKIVAHKIPTGPSSNDSRLYFTVHTVGNQTLTYGGKLNSILTDNNGSSQGVVFSWAISSRVDADGNEISYKYNSRSAIGELYPTEIDYTVGNGNPGTMRKVTFSWEPREAIGASNIVHYLNGMEQSTTQLLTGIKTWAPRANNPNSTEVRSYTLHYTKSVATGRPLMNSVQVCAYVSGSKNCFKPTTFSYQGEHAPHYVSENPPGVHYVTPENTCSYGGAYWSGYPTDINGDGLTDLVRFIQKQDGTFEESVQYGKAGTLGGFGSAELFDSTLSQPSNHEWGLMHIPIDFNLDGRTDALIVDGTFDSSGSEVSAELKVAYQDTSDTNAGTFTLKDLGIAFPPNPPAFIDGFPTYARPPFQSRLQTADINGDGKPDIAFEDEPSNGVYKWQVYLAQGTGNATSYSHVQTLSAPGESDFLTSLDYDADGRGDLLVHYKDAGHYVLLRSTGGGFESIDTNIPFIKDATNVPVPIVVADLNGDSLPDVLEPEQDSSGAWHWFAYMNKGTANGQFAPRHDTGLAVAGSGGYGMALANMVKVVRDPDGRQDLLMATHRSYIAPIIARVCPESGGRPVGYCHSIQTQSQCNAYDIRKPSELRPGTDQKDGYDWRLYRAGGNGDSPTLTNTGIGASDVQDMTVSQTLDFNHDGLPDFSGQVAKGPGYDSFVAKRLSYADGSTGDPMPDLLHQATNGLGVQATWTYQPVNHPSVGTLSGTSNYPNMSFESPMQVVMSFSQSNPVKGANNTDTYQYKNPRYNVAGRGFEGFEQITVHDKARGLKTITQYKQKFPLAGRVVKSETFKTGDSTPFSVTSDTWKPVPYSGIGAKRYMVYAASSSDRETDPKAGFALISQSDTSQSNVDLCGNAHYTTSKITTQQSTKTVDTTSIYNGTDSVDACDQETPHSQTATTTLSYTQIPTTSDKLTVTTTYGYDSSKWWQLTSKKVTAPHAGDNRTRNWAYGYDKYGNRTSVTQKDAIAGTSRTTTTNYGSDGYFPVSITNAKGQTSTATYDPATGNKTLVADPNGVWTQYAYDPFGRKLGSWSEGESKVKGEYLDPTASGIDCPSNGGNTSAYALRKTQAGYPTSFTCFDAYGDQLRSATASFGGGWVAVDSTYDALGQIKTKTIPFYAGQSSTALETSYGTYDVLGRPASKTVPTMRGTRTIAMRYSGFTITYTDTDNHTGVTHHYIRYYDGLGKGNGHLVEVRQQKNNGKWVSSTYRYDAGGNLVRATDAAGNAITATYDGFGDKLTLNDPDQGKSSYTYDGYGEQVTSTNGRGQTISTVYDKLGRPTQVSDPADNRITKTTYDAGPQGIGKPHTESLSVNGSVVYKRQYGYDEDGRQTATDITTGGVSYVQGVAYDSYGRPVQQAYPALSGGGGTSGPTVSASVNPSGPVNLNSKVTLNATASDPNGDWALTFQWKKISGPSASIATDDAQTTDVTLSTAGTYTFQVTANDGFATSKASVSIVVEPPSSAIETPTASTGTSYSGSYTLSWVNVNGADTFQLQESHNGGAWGIVYNGTALSANLHGRSAGNYRYQVRGCNPIGCAPWGGTTSVTVEAPTGTVIPSVSPSPSVDGSYTVSWGNVTGASTYQLQESANGGAWTMVQNSGARSWPASGKGSGSYQYRVRACSAVGCGSWGGTVTENVNPPVTGGATRISPAPSYTGVFTVSWSAILRATSYQLEQSSNNGSWGIVYSGNNRSWSASGKGVGSYRYRVRGCDSVGCGTWGSITLEIVKVPPAPGTPALTPNPSANGSYTVSWGAESGASTYQLQQSANGGGWTTVHNTSSRSWSTSGHGNGVYRYRVRTCNNRTGCGSWSGTATENVYLPPGTPTLSPSYKSITGGNSYTLSWTMPSGEVTKFQLEAGGSGTFTNATPQNVGTAQSKTYTSSPTSMGNDAYYRIRACNHSVCGNSWSNTSHIFIAPSGGGCTFCSPLASPTYTGATVATTTTTSNSSSTSTNKMTTATTASTTTTNHSGGTGAMVVKTTYNAYGYPVSLTRKSDGYVYMHVAAIDVWGHATMVYEGGSGSSNAVVMATRADDPRTGLVTSLMATNASTSALLAKFTSAWDGFGNLTSRTAEGSTETATYDALNRLTGSTTTLNGGGGTVTHSYQYNDIGNRTEACSDTQCTDFSYGKGISVDGAGPHAVNTVTTPNGTIYGSNDYAYNADGQMTRDYNLDAGALRKLTRNAFGKAESISQSQTTVNFSYGPGNSRYKKVVTGIESETVTYLGGAEVLNVGGSKSIRRTLGFAGLTVIDTGGANAGLRFALPDHLGSVMALVDSSGNLKESLSYGNFGKRYTGGWGSPLPTNQAWAINTTLTDKGYTGQESLDSVGLDDYNARLYDPALGRFLSTDPLISHPGSTQSINPYSYVENNPLNKVDPTGQSAVTDALSCNSAGSHLCSGGSQGSITGSNEVKDAVHQEESLGKAFGGLSKAQGDAVLAKYGQGVYSSGGSFTKALDDAAFWTNLKSFNASFNTNSHSQSSGSSGAGAPTTKSDSQFSWGDALKKTGAAGLEVGGDVATLKEWSKVFGGQWKGANGKWNSLDWGGNGWTGGRTKVLSAAEHWKLVGRGLFGIGVIISGTQGIADLRSHNYRGAGKSLLDIGVSLLAEFGGYLGGLAGFAEVGGPVGLIVGVAYFGIGMLPGGWPAVLRDQNELIMQDEAIMGPGWSPYGGAQKE